MTSLQALTTAIYNTAIGYNASRNVTTGNSNTTVGTDSLNTCTTGDSNCAFGYNSLQLLTTGDNNVAVGLWAGTYVNALTTGQYNVFLGNFTRGSTTTPTRQHVIGYNMGALAGDGTFSVQAASGAYQSNNSANWSTTSDRRIKKNIVENTTGLDAIEKIQVRNFEYKKSDENVADNPELENVIDSISEKPTGQQLGVIAQEIEEILPDVVETQTTGIKTVNPDNLTWYLVNAVKELSAKNTALENRVTTLEAA